LAIPARITLVFELEDVFYREKFIEKSVRITNGFELYRAITESLVNCKFNWKKWFL